MDLSSAKRVDSTEWALLGWMSLYIATIESRVAPSPHYYAGAIINTVCH